MQSGCAPSWRRGRIGFLIQGDQLGRIAVEDFEQRAQDFVIAGHARLVVLEHVHLDQQAGAVFEDHLAGGEARRIAERDQALGGIGFVPEIDRVGKATWPAALTWRSSSGVTSLRSQWAMPGSTSGVESA